MLIVQLDTHMGGEGDFVTKHYEQQFNCTGYRPENWKLLL